MTVLDSQLRTEFYSMPPEGLVDRPTWAAVRYVKVATIEAEAINGGGPPYIRINRKALYKKADLLDWMERNSKKRGGNFAYDKVSNSQIEE